MNDQKNFSITNVVHDLAVISYGSLLATIRLCFHFVKTVRTGSKTASILTHNSLLDFLFSFNYLLIHGTENQNARARTLVAQRLRRVN